jgi:putative endonuclease
MPRPPPELRRGGSLTRKSSGAWGEDLALRYLTRQGYTLVERNFRKRRGEIDLIVRNGQTLVFVEVKLRRSTGFGDPLEAVTARKQATIRSLAEQYLADNQPDFDTLRFDVVGILATHTGIRIDHIEDAF